MAYHCTIDNVKICWSRTKFKTDQNRTKSVRCLSLLAPPHSQCALCWTLICKQCNSTPMSFQIQDFTSNSIYLFPTVPVAPLLDQFCNLWGIWSLCMVNTTNNNISRACRRHKYGSFMFIISISQPGMLHQTQRLPLILVHCLASWQHIYIHIRTWCQ